jgi:ABC-type nitrate/sulfonate/bicarbonate transport system permease component
LHPRPIGLEANLPARVPAAQEEVVEAPTASADRLFRLLPVLLVAGGLLLWEAASRAGLLSSLLYPPPSAIGRAIGRAIGGGDLAAHLAASAARIGAGFGVGGGGGLLLGLLMGWSRRVRLALDPLVAVAHPLPRLALLPLVLLLFGIGETSRIVVVAISCFFPLLISATAGVRQIDPVLFDVARSFGARPHQVFARVVLPGSVPALMAGSRLSLISALKTTVGIELIVADSGLGPMIWFAWETFRTDDLYAALVIVALLGFGLNHALGRLVALVTPGTRGVS